MSNKEIIEANKMLIGIEGELNTYQAWKELGYQVQKGQKAFLTTKLWKQVTKKNKDGNIDKKYYLVNSALFTKDQVSLIN